LRSDGTIERAYIVEGTTDDVQAEAEAFAKAPTIYRGMVRGALPDTDPIGRGIFEVTFTYSPLESDPNEGTDEPQGELPTLATLEIDGSGGTEHVTQCVKQTSYGPIAAREIVDRRIVGLHKDGVNGVDIDVPGNVITMTCKWLPAAVTGDYVKKLLDLRGMTNKAPYTIKWGYKKQKYEIEFPAGELRYLYTKMSTTLTRKGTGVIEMSYSMLHSKNKKNITLTDGSNGIIIPEKRGHDYLWVFHKKQTLTGDLKVTIEVPHVAFLSTLYEEEDFKSILGF
jgi:hypothetical protein